MYVRWPFVSPLRCSFCIHSCLPRGTWPSGILENWQFLPLVLHCLSQVIWNTHYSSLLVNFKDIVTFFLNTIFLQLQPARQTAIMRFVQQDAPRPAVASLSPRTVRALPVLKAAHVTKVLSWAMVTVWLRSSVAVLTRACTTSWARSSSLKTSASRDVYAKRMEEFSMMMDSPANQTRSARSWMEFRAVSLMAKQFAQCLALGFISHLMGNSLMLKETVSIDWQRQFRTKIRRDLLVC